MLPMLLADFREQRPDVTVKLTEDKTIRLLPALISGRLDLALVRPPEKPDKRLEFLFLLHETAVVAMSDHHPLASRKRVSVADLAEQPLIVPERRSRPHSHDLTMKLFAQAGCRRASSSWPMKSRPSSIWSRPSLALPSCRDGRHAWRRAAFGMFRSKPPI